MTPIYHITHVDNLALMVADGYIRCDADIRRLGRAPVAIGYADLKEKRLRYPVVCGPRGVLGDYVPFYFAPRSPMLYAIWKGYVHGYAGTQAEIVTLCSTAERVRDAGHGFVFTNGHAVAALTDFYDDLAQLHEVDWEVMPLTYWHDVPDDGDRRRRRQAELLVHRVVPWALVDSAGVMSEAMAERVSAILGATAPPPTVAVRREWYY